MKKLGVIINPIAGMGGRVGLKGSDGVDVLSKARELGARPESPQKAVEALKIIARVEDRLEVIAYPDEMGEDECREAGLAPVVIGSIPRRETTAEDTEKAAQKMAALKVDLLLFAGGDGTARDIYNAVQDRVPALGIPAGVKIHSAVYAVTPRSAGELVVMFVEGEVRGFRDAEVMDIDEDAFRRGILSARLFGYLRVPEESRYVQDRKSTRLNSSHVEISYAVFCLKKKKNNKSRTAVTSLLPATFSPTSKPTSIYPALTVLLLRTTPSFSVSPITFSA